jgi:short-subunit dehydrogenase
MKITPMLKLLMMKPGPVVRTGIKALHAGRMSIVPGVPNKLMTLFMQTTPRRLHQAVLAQVMSA